MLLSKRKAQKHAARHTDKTHSSRRRLERVNELRGGWFARNPTRAREFGLHRRARDGRALERAAQARLALLRPRPLERKIRGRSSRGPASKGSPRRSETRFLRQDLREPRHPYFRSSAQRPRCRRSPRIRPFVFRASRSLKSQRTHRRTFDRRPRPARLPGPIPQRIWPDGRRALLRSPPRKGAFLDATGLVRSENDSRPCNFQSRQLPQTPPGERS